MSTLEVDVALGIALRHVGGPDFAELRFLSRYLYSVWCESVGAVGLPVNAAVPCADMAAVTALPVPQRVILTMPATPAPAYTGSTSSVPLESLVLCWVMRASLHGAAILQPAAPQRMWTRFRGNPVIKAVHSAQGEHAESRAQRATSQLPAAWASAGLAHLDVNWLMDAASLARVFSAVMPSHVQHLHMLTSAALPYSLMASVVQANSFSLASIALTWCAATLEEHASLARLLASCPKLRAVTLHDVVCTCREHIVALGVLGAALAERRGKLELHLGGHEVGDNGEGWPATAPACSSDPALELAISHPATLSAESNPGKCIAALLRACTAQGTRLSLRVLPQLGHDARLTSQLVAGAAHCAMQTLELDGFTLSASGSRWIDMAFQSPSFAGLRCLELCHSTVHASIVPAVFQLLARAGGLQVLRLRQLESTASSPFSLAHALASWADARAELHLQVLDISFNALTTLDCVAALSDFLRVCPQLQQLQARGCVLGGAGIAAVLTRIMHSCSGIRSIDLMHNPTAARGVGTAVAWHPHHSGGGELTLQLEADQATWRAAVARGIARAPWWQASMPMPAFAHAVVAALAACPQLECVQLQSNALTEAAFFALCSISHLYRACALHIDGSEFKEQTICRGLRDHLVPGRQHALELHLHGLGPYRMQHWPVMLAKDADVQAALERSHTSVHCHL